MSEMSYLSVIERYHEYGNEIRELLASIATGIVGKRLCDEEEALSEAIVSIVEYYPFVDHIYLLDNDGKQLSPILKKNGKPFSKGHDVGTDRSLRPYFIKAKNQQDVDVTISKPYFSNIGRHLCISAVTLCSEADNIYVVIDIDLREIIEFLMGDSLRGRFNPLFKIIYSIIAIGLFTVVGVLLFFAFSEIIDMLSELGSEMSDSDSIYLKPFSVIIFLTLALAIFDLGKTTIEEEVLMHKDIFRHSSTRRTITRFIAAILIAVSIEALLLMFKSALGNGENILAAVWMMFSAVGLLVGLGIYVYLGARAESFLRNTYGTEGNRKDD
ncbi:MAG: general glycosylation pathway protein [Gammaproteobacteria bacterium]|nr:MAG: general glycosylation pathway protein [Gammaproteobacteria bacterium]